MIVENEVQLTDSVIHEMRNTQDARGREVLESMVRHLHNFAREVRLTEKEFDIGLRAIAKMGQMTNASHNEVRLMAGSLGLSMLICLINNAETGTADTSANLLGPFWRANPPVTPNGGSIVRSETGGVPMFFTGTVVDSSGNPVAGAEVDVWQTSPVGLYENQDANQADWNLRGKFITDENGVFAYRSIKPTGYPIPTDGPVGDFLRFQNRSPFRPAHLHALIYKPGFKTIASELYTADDPAIDTDTQFGVTRPLMVEYTEHNDEPAPAPDVTGTWYSLDHRFVLEPGEAFLPVPPISGKATKEPATAA
ncbi:MAG TPA: dioxygenase [Sphingobium sp.]|nr:dioxygenase [Sphingobium sp.]